MNDTADFKGLSFFLTPSVFTVAKPSSSSSSSNSSSNSSALVVLSSKFEIASNPNLVFFFLVTSSKSVVFSPFVVRVAFAATKAAFVVWCRRMARAIGFPSNIRRVVLGCCSPRIRTPFCGGNRASSSSQIHLSFARSLSQTATRRRRTFKDERQHDDERKRRSSLTHNDEFRRR